MAANPVSGRRSVKGDNVRRFLTSDVVAALLAHFPEDQFQSTPTELQASFRQVAKAFPVLLGNVSFGKVGAYVSSTSIDAALDSLAASGFYSRYNKDLVTHDLNRAKLKSYYDDFLNQRFADSGVPVDTIIEAAALLKESVSDLYKSPNRQLFLVT